MGSCVSVHKSSQESAMKIGLSFGSKTDNLIIPPSLVKEKPDAANGSEDESFFDSRAYLDLDCDDDFFSVNGDFTPSGGNTPLHHNSFSMEAPRNYKATEDGSPGSAWETYPGKKKKLVELFRDNINEDQDVVHELNASINQDTANRKLEVKPKIQEILPPKSADGTPQVSRTNSWCSSKRTANGDNLMFKEKPLSSTQSCLPSLVSCNSFSERKKKMSPAIVNYKP
ncbi:Myzus persicae-induced lipase 1 isoform 1 [Hibiscus syriacus]|uniref:Myzus persicae-induced lipase 1 isoform 1 n=1 Tax=Hibiscus syriacus TaxID=106335 RepID=A0A6A3ATH7_HIBSY|nr:uncharacterized protein At3g27210-like [Hibiscus syriacus]KAE8706677.1 Myzus persicae-induced lipase 1 isoform 1 [Hibiscus syriacus]